MAAVTVARTRAAQEAPAADLPHGADRYYAPGTMKSSRLLLVPLVALAVLVGCAPAKVAPKKVVSVSYTLTLADGTVFDKSEDGKPLEFMVGAGKMIPAFETNITGLKVGDKKNFTIKAVDAYGDYKKDAVVDVPRGQFPDDPAPKAGDKFSVTTASGPYTVTVVKVTKDTVTIDTNSPLAGKDLTFDVKIEKIRDATKDELLELQNASSATAQ
jgi:FKBP-type peptidyl-prolyl cis-trans isomerase 2